VEAGLAYWGSWCFDAASIHDSRWLHYRILSICTALREPKRNESRLSVEVASGCVRFGLSAQPRSDCRINAADESVFSSGSLAQTNSRVDLDLQLPEGIRGNRVVLTLIGHEDPSCGGFAEIRVFGLRD